MIKVKLGAILDSVPTMNKLIDQHLEIKTAYKIARLARELQKETELFQSTRMELINKYGKKDENENLIKEENENFSIPQENSKAFTEEFNELIQQEVEINAEKLKLEELEKAELTPQQIISLMDYIEE